MSEDPQRLVDEMSSGPWADLLRGAAPSDTELPLAVRARVHRRVASSIVAGLAVTSGSGSARAAVDQGAGAVAEKAVSSAVGLKGTALPAALLKWMGLLAFGGGLAAGVYNWHEHSSPVAQPQLGYEQKPASAASSEAPTIEERPQTAPAVALTDLPLEELEPTRAPAAPVSARSSLMEEAKLLQLARDALTSNPKECLRLAEDYPVRFPKGQLGREARKLIERAKDQLSSRDGEEPGLPGARVDESE